MPNENYPPELKTIYKIAIAVITVAITIISCTKDFKQTGVTTATSQNKSVTDGGKPNILFILGDDIGYEVLTGYGGQSYQTPNLDWLYSQGMHFNNCYATPSCSPSRFMLLTGKYNFRNYKSWGKMNPTTKTIGNMFSNAGYGTCYVGKWQLDGGDNSIRAFGWQQYTVWLPFKMQGGENKAGSRYGDPVLYRSAAYMPDSLTKGKYADDICTDYMLNFIDSMSNTGNPFFAYYSMLNCHGPFCPTPDDPEFATWDYKNLRGDPSFYPNMVKYMDKKVGQIIHHLDSSGLLENTIIFYVTDNGTSSEITSIYDGYTVQGGKATYTEIGTAVPLIAYWKNHFPSGVSNDMIDFTDFLPTLAEAASIPVPTTWGTLDGKSFYPALIPGTDSTNKGFIYDAYTNSLSARHPFVRWIQNNQYKLFDTVAGTPNSGQFVKVQKCRPDTVLAPNNLTQEQADLRNNMINMLYTYRTDTQK